jgi:arylsulfatase A-like enzyme
MPPNIVLFMTDQLRRDGSERMVRTARWKYVYIPHDRDELYDLEADPAEMHNLVDDSEHSEILEQMKARLIGWNDATNDMF